MLKLINAGLGRTGTTSLKVALERLGFGPCYHMFDIVSNEARLAQWERIIYDGQRPDWAAVFDGYTSAVDGPPSLYYKQLTEAYPEAAVILTVRDADRWYQSMHDTLYQFALRTPGGASDAGSLRYRVHRLADAMSWQGFFGGRFADKDYAIDAFRRHNQDVVDTIGRNNLLVYDVTQGWEPLCGFLGVDVPPGEFPHVNDTESMRKNLEL